MSRQVSRRAVLGAGLPFAAALGGCSESGSGRRSTSPQSSGPTGTAPGSTSTDSPAAARTGQVRVRVSGTAPRGRREGYLTDALAAVAPVEQVWGTSSVPGRVEVLAPATRSEFTELTGSTSAGIPALTRPDGHIVIHPDLWERTSAPGREVVLRHELTHVALGQGAWTGVPRWVVEGSAELTAYRVTDLSPAEIAPGVARRIRAGDAPTGPPTDAQVAGSDGYGLAWAWCRYLVERSGWSTFTAFVRRAGRAGSETGTQRAFRAAYDVAPGRLAAGYSTWLASWA